MPAGFSRSTGRPQMNLRDLHAAAKTFGAADHSLTVAFGQAWHAKESYRDGQVDFANISGVYLYTEPCVPDWRVPFAENRSAVWYIGKSNGGQAGRVWKHLGRVNEPGTRTPCVPQSKYHRWAEKESVPRRIRDAVANRNLVVYTIGVQPLGNPPGNAKSMEKYLLEAYVRSVGSLPPLNSRL